MTSEEIKEKYSMEDILLKYGIHPDKKGFISCPFHREKTASMKIYKDSYYCFGCGAAGDIFSFLMQKEGISFKEAYLSLGGTYRADSFQEKMAQYHLQKKRIMLQKELKRKREQIQLSNKKIAIYRKTLEKAEPLSQTWTDCYNALQLELYRQEVLNELR